MTQSIIVPVTHTCDFIASFNDFQLNNFRMVTPRTISHITIKCSSEDPAPTSFMKAIFPAFLTSVSDLINLSFETGSFPSSLRDAVVVPIIKDRKGDVNQLKNYRPVSLINFLSKVIDDGENCSGSA